ncbi:MAG TPA: exopolysaccharide transport family protein [Rhizomicrobium sp.]|nr:exopolysaccharide transport family protein [Rhizomicrobium sp.]
MSFHGVDPDPAAGPSFGEILAALRARLGLVLCVTAGVVAIAIVVVTLLPARYTSSSVVMLDPRKNTIADLSAVLSQLPTDPASIQNQIQILTSRDLAVEVIAKLKLYDDPEFNPSLQPSVGGALLAAVDPKNWFADREPLPPDPAVQRDTIVDNFLTHLWAESVGLSTTITVNFSSRDAKKAAAIADAVTQTYVDDLVAAKLRASDATSTWLTQRIRDLGGQVQAQEAAALTYRAQHNLDSSQGGTSLIEAQLGGINGQIVQARADLSAKQAVYNQVQTLMKAGNPADISQIVASPLIIQLRTQQADLLKQEAALAIPYGPKHPKRIAVENQLKDLGQKIDEEGARIASSLASDVAVARAQLNSLQGSFGTTQHQASGQDMTAVKLRALEADADSSRKLYDAFLGRLTTIQDQEGLQYPDAHIISRAAVPASPSSPQRMLIVTASLPAGLMLGCLIALLSTRFAPRTVPRPVRPQPRPVPARAPAPARAVPPLLADIPGALVEGAADHIVDWPASPFARAVSALLGRVLLNCSPGSGRVVAVTTSESPAAGTTVALALARAAAARGLRTILIDGHLVHPVLGEAAHIRPAAGLLEVLGRSVTLNRALVRDSRSDALLLALSKPPRDPRAVLASPRMGELFAHLRSLCDLAIVTAPPVLASAEAPSLARLADAVVMVAHPDEGPRPGLRQALAALGRWRSAPVGMVLVR